jgi:mannose-6-phosphate isomerase-like protein (cupin superfamily)
MDDATVAAFELVSWVEEGPGVRVRALPIAGQRWALVEYEPSAGRDVWCREGHRAYVVEGAIHYEFEDGREPLAAVAGQGFYLPAGTGHKGRNHHFERTRLFVVDDPRG